MQQSCATSQGMQAARSAPQGQADQPPNHLVRTAQGQLNSWCIQVLKDQSKAKKPPAQALERTLDLFLICVFLK